MRIMRMASAVDAAEVLPLPSRPSRVLILCSSEPMWLLSWSMICSDDIFARCCYRRCMGPDRGDWGGRKYKE